MTEPNVQRLLIVMENFVMGGVERVTLRLLQALILQQPTLNIIIAVQYNEGAMAAEFNQALKVVTLPSGTLAQGKKLRQLVKSHQSQLVLFTKGGLSRFQLFLPRNVRSVAVQHVPITLPGLTTGRNLLRRAVAALCYRLVDKVVTVSDGLNQDVRAALKLPSSKVITIYNPVLTDSVIHLAQQSLPLQVSQLPEYFLCVGRLDYQKGYDLLLQIWQKPELAQRHVCIIGDGPLHGALVNDIARLGLSANVHLLGADANPFRFMRHAKALLLPSRFEGLPTVLVEAAALNCQLIAFDCPHGPFELLKGGNNGFLIKAGDTQAFANAIEAVARGKKKPLPDVYSFFSDSAAKNYYQLFNQLCRRLN